MHDRPSTADDAEMRWSERLRLVDDDGGADVGPVV